MEQDQEEVSEGENMEQDQEKISKGENNESKKRKEETDCEKREEKDGEEDEQKQKKKEGIQLQRRTCKLINLGRNIINTLSQISREKNVKQLGYAKITIQDLPPLDLQSIKDLIPSIDASNLVNIEYSSIPTGLRLSTSCQQLHTLPTEFSTGIHSSTNLNNAFKSAIKTINGSTRQYGIFEPTFSSFTPKVHPGHKLQELPRIPGVNTPYWYINYGPFTGTAIHIKDTGLSSVNLLLAGCPKVWSIIPPSIKQKLENKIREELSIAGNLYSQFIRHEFILLSPLTLKSWGISYNIIWYRKGNLIFTTPNLYH